MSDPLERFRTLAPTTCISPERFRTLTTENMTDDEALHITQCDYCCEGSLLQDDPDEYDAKSRKQQGRPFTPRRPKGD